MECLQGLIGLKGCITGRSGKNIDYLPGIQLKAFDKIATASQNDFQGLFNDIQSIAIDRIVQDFETYLASKYRLRRTRQSLTLPKKIESTTTAGSTNYYGVYIDLTCGDYVDSNLQSIYIQKFYFYSNFVQAGQVFKVFDVETGNELTDITKDLAAGWNEIVVETNYYTNQIFIAIAGDGLTLQNTDISKESSAAKIYPECYDLGCLGFYKDNTLKLMGGVSPVADKFNVNSGGFNTYGIMPVFSLHCDYKTLICSNVGLLSLPLQYLMGVVFNDFRLNTDQLNEYVAYDRNTAEKNMASLEDHYDRFMTNALAGIVLNTDDGCIDCNSQVVFAESIL